ncbi:MAG: hypothetical protein JST54_27625 [Deltaproteobacteria bacterium]|nr:hypothetical protein [Deltaproteobacteria bacterium]
MSKLTLLCAALACGALLAGCGSSTAGSCNASNCKGCCDASGVCQLPSAQTCGVSGAACQACNAGNQCVNGTCEQPGGVTGGSSSGSTASTSSGSTSSGSTTTTSTGSSGTTATTAGASSTTTTTTTTSGSGATSGTTGNCCAALNCPGGCDINACTCLGGTTTTGTTGTSGSFDAGAICGTQACVVYAESQHTLYRVDPNPPNTLTSVCDFNGAIPGDAGVNDIAVQRNGALWGITRTDLYSIDANTCAGTHVAALAQSAGGFNGLTFSDADTLVAADADGHVVTIDTTTGQVSDAGHFGTNLGCSGDIVALSDGTFYATAKILDGGSNATDVLVTLDPNNGYFATRVSSQSTGYHGIFGLGYWAGEFYGFDRNGNVLTIDPVTGVATLIHNEPNTVFYGAGTTPLAPIVTHN